MRKFVKGSYYIEGPTMKLLKKTDDLINLGNSYGYAIECYEGEYLDKQVLGIDIYISKPTKGLCKELLMAFKQEAKKLGKLNIVMEGWGER